MKARCEYAVPVALAATFALTFHAAAAGPAVWRWTRELPAEIDTTKPAANRRAQEVDAAFRQGPLVRTSSLVSGGRTASVGRVYIRETRGPPPTRNRAARSGSCFPTAKSYMFGLATWSMCIRHCGGRERAGQSWSSSEAPPNNELQRTSDGNAAGSPLNVLGDRGLRCGCDH